MGITSETRIEMGALNDSVGITVLVAADSVRVVVEYVGKRENTQT